MHFYDLLKWVKYLIKKKKNDGLFILRTNILKTEKLLVNILN